jgi:hypothetical protein
MNRFKLTFLAIAAVLLFLGWNDLSLTLTNPEPLPIDIENIVFSDTLPQEWVTIQHGTLLLDEAISMTGALDIKALLIPIVSQDAPEHFRIWIETRNEEILSTFIQYHLGFDSEAEKANFREAYPERFHIQRDVTALAASGHLAKANQRKIQKLQAQAGQTLPENTVLLSEGKTPNTWRGALFMVLALLTIAKIIFGFIKSKKEVTQNTVSNP